MKASKYLASLSLLSSIALLTLSADAATYTFVQVNGVECNPNSAADYDKVTWGWGGIRAIKAGAEVTCPVTRASIESYDLHASAPIYREHMDIYAYFNTGAEVWCTFVKQTSFGSMYLAQMVKDNDWVAAQRMKVSVSRDLLESTVAEYVHCTLPLGTALRGLSSMQSLQAGSAGGALGPVKPFPP